MDTVKVQGVPCAHGLGWVDLNFECSAVCPIMPWPMHDGLKWLGCRERWWNNKIKVGPTQTTSMWDTTLNPCYSPSNYWDDRSLLQLFLENNGRVDVFDHQGRSALHMAAENGSIEVGGE